ncbi:TonB family protein [Mucilaginibacter daejeonensis]|uniref:energy transducer TonB n=1 Tax=Mucilaginibacter daejeonensis TaxID=398049 RepID=UPI001D1710DD|nr:energy transducer TonB [Mucilaginibacter daejeonensis]UEG53388.1 TonB family protein [Mucilaginibacter daejeonensis]
MRYLFLLAFSVSFVNAFAQRQNVYFFNKREQQVATRDSADYTRIVREPDPGSELYKVMEYYLNGRPKRMATSITIDPIKLEGPCTIYDRNGIRQSVLNFHEGRMANEQVYYYPNGTISEVRNYAEGMNDPRNNFNSAYLITANNDSTGKALVTAGNGHYRSPVNNDLFMTEGDIKDGLKEGEWKTSVKKDSLILIETYSKGKLITGTGKLANGETYTYTKDQALPEFVGGVKAFYAFLRKNLRYPAEAFQNRIQGRVDVAFIVELDGALTDVHAVGRPQDKVLTAEAIRVLKLSPKWVPGVRYGRPVRVTYTVPVVFSL